MQYCRPWSIKWDTSLGRLLPSIGCSWGTEFSTSNTRTSITMLVPRLGIWDLAVEGIISCGRRAYHKLSPLPLTNKNWRILAVPEAKRRTIPSPERGIYRPCFIERFVCWVRIVIPYWGDRRKNWENGSLAVSKSVQRDLSHVSKVAELQGWTRGWSEGRRICLPVWKAKDVTRGIKKTRINHTK